MAERPIIFSGPMIRALLEGRKTQTRRLATSPLRRAQAGDRLWVRESGNWQSMTEVAPEPGRQRGVVWYAATGEPSGLSFFGNKQRPSIHMPRCASRLTLAVVGVLIEPLHQISEQDALAEGAEVVLPIDARSWYRMIWTELHGRESWEKNPLVVALEFEVTEGNIDGARPA